MQCPNLMEFIDDGIIWFCKAGGKPYVPSLFELEEYCKTESHKKCPFIKEYSY